jgi:hypothetical protein
MNLNTMVFRSRKHRCWYMRTGIFVVLFSLLKVQNHVSGDLDKLGNNIFRCSLTVFLIVYMSIVCRLVLVPVNSAGPSHNLHEELHIDFFLTQELMA